MVKLSRYGGWPIDTPSKAFPNELTISCPNCRSTDITLTGEPIGRGSGVGGAYRLGDRYRGVAVCNGCGNRGYAATEGR